MIWLDCDVLFRKKTGSWEHGRERKWRRESSHVAGDFGAPDQDRRQKPAEAGGLFL